MHSIIQMKVLTTFIKSSSSEMNVLAKRISYLESLKAITIQNPKPLMVLNLNLRTFLCQIVNSESKHKSGILQVQNSSYKSQQRITGLRSELSWCTTSPTSSPSSICETGSTKSASTQTTVLSSLSLPTRQIWWRMTTARKDMADSQIKGEKVWTAKIIQI